MRRALACAVLVALALALATAAENADDLAAIEKKLEAEVHGDPRAPAEDRLSLAKILHFRGVDGDVSAARESSALLEHLAEERADDATVLAYLGSARLLSAKTAWAPWQKVSLVRQGLELLDRAVARAPQDPEVKFLRGASTRPLPRVFGRAEQSANDLTDAAAHAKEATSQGRLDKQLAAAIFYLYGFTRLDRNDRPGTEVAWKTAYDLAPASKAGRKAAGRLGLP